MRVEINSEAPDQINGLVNGEGFHLSLNTPATSGRARRISNKSITDAIERHVADLIADWHECWQCANKCPPGEALCILCHCKTRKRARS